MLTAGEPIDERGPIVTDKFASIHADAPEFVDMSVEQEILVTGTNFSLQFNVMLTIIHICLHYFVLQVLKL